MLPRIGEQNYVSDKVKLQLGKRKKSSSTSSPTTKRGKGRTTKEKELF